jgi:hypothetical protein
MDMHDTRLLTDHREESVAPGRTGGPSVLPPVGTGRRAGIDALPLLNRSRAAVLARPQEVIMLSVASRIGMPPSHGFHH